MSHYVLNFTYSSQVGALTLSQPTKLRLVTFEEDILSICSSIYNTLLAFQELRSVRGLPSENHDALSYLPASIKQ